MAFVNAIYDSVGGSSCDVWWKALDVLSWFELT